MEHKEEYDAVKMGELVAAKLLGELSEAQEKLLNDWLHEHAEYQNVYEFLINDNTDVLSGKMKRYDKATALTRINNKRNKMLKKKKQIVWYAAASLILFIGLGCYWMMAGKDIINGKESVSRYGDDVIAGNENAKIIMADGSVYQLDTTQAGIQVKGNSLRYEDGRNIVSGSDPVNATLVTPKGRQYRIMLPDGTKVVLNAATSLSYPSRFTGKERLVELDGEAYFEVSHNAAQPFRVKSSKQDVVVLGTRFNISTYQAEKPITTLLEGKVRLQNKNNGDIILTPGQQAKLENSTFNVNRVTAEDYTAWINNEFVFNNLPLNEVFAVLGRWYDVSFEYPGELADKRIYAEITRKRKLSEVLQILEEVTGLHFSIKERRVIIKK